MFLAEIVNAEFPVFTMGDSQSLVVQKQEALLPEGEQDDS
jgi:hypothetical protein